MKSKLILPTVLVVFAAACGGDEGVAKADQKNFEVVQEGSASGVTSTIQGPGESLPPITGTNADTTTAFTIDPNAAVAVPPPAVAGGVLESTLPPAAPERRITPPQNTPRPDPREMREDPRPAPPTMTAEPPAPAPPQEANPVPPQKEQNEDQEPEPQDEPEEVEPPPPTNTDTRGQ